MEERKSGFLVPVALDSSDWLTVSMHLRSALTQMERNLGYWEDRSRDRDADGNCRFETADKAVRIYLDLIDDTKRILSAIYSQIGPMKD